MTTASFERFPTDADEALFKQLTSGLVGAPLVRVRESFAEGLVLDFGTMISAKVGVRSPHVAGARGEWAVSKWGCNVSYASGGEQPSHRPGFQELLRALCGLVGETVREAEFTQHDRCLILQFAGGSELRFVPDEDDVQVDQWFVQLPTRQSLGVTGAGKLYLRPDSGFEG